MQTLKILIDLADQKPELSTDFLNATQKELGLKEKEFWEKLCLGWQFLADRENGNAGENLNSIKYAAFNTELLGLTFYLAFSKGKEDFSKVILNKEGLSITFNALTHYALEHRLNWYYYSYTGKQYEITYNYSPLKLYEHYKALSELKFKKELISKQPEQLADFLSIHFKKFVREGGEKADWLRHTKRFANSLSIEQQDKFYDWFELNNTETKPKANKRKIEETKPNSFEELFYDPKDAEPCLRLLGELTPPVIDAANNFIGKAKGVFPLWIKVLLNNKPQPLIKHCKDIVYKDLLNQKIKGLNLSKDASEFRKDYKRLNNNKTELDIKTILSQYSQSGKLGK